MDEKCLQEDNDQRSDGCNSNVLPYQGGDYNDNYGHGPQVIDECGDQVEAAHIVGHQIYHLSWLCLAKAQVVEFQNLKE